VELFWLWGIFVVHFINWFLFLCKINRQYKYVSKCVGTYGILHRRWVCIIDFGGNLDPSMGQAHNCGKISSLYIYSLIRHSNISPSSFKNKISKNNDVVYKLTSSSFIAEIYLSSKRGGSIRLYYAHNKSVACTMYYILKQLIKTYMSSLLRRARFFSNLHQVHS
jgi:hypothetical protein